MNEPFLKIPHSVLLHTELSWLEKIIVAHRLSYAENFFASNEYVAEYFSTTKKTVMQAYQKARKLGILPEEQMLMNDIITQTGSYDNIIYSHLQVSGSHFTVTTSHLQVSGSHLQVTDESPTGERKEAILPMKNDVLLDQYIRLDILESNIRSVRLPETGSFIKSNTIQNIKSKPNTEGKLDIIIQSSKLGSYHKVNKIYPDSLKQDNVYAYSKGWWLGLSKSDYDKAAQSLIQTK